MNGVLIINKEKGMTSRDVVNKLMRYFNTRKIGHTGTLDPLATGVLVTTIGKYTKLNDVLMSTEKEYIATMQLGVKTDTLDNTGTILAHENINIEKSLIKEVIASFIGSYIQEVPIYSAVKVNGRKLYEYARNNEEISLPSREVYIKEIEILSIEENIITFRTVVSKGTYIRSLIRDIGIKLNTNAIMTDLKRTKQGIFDINNSITLSDIEKDNYKLYAIDEILDVDIKDISDELTYKQVNNGVKMEINSDKEFVLFKSKNKEIALYRKDEKNYKMFLKLV